MPENVLYILHNATTLLFGVYISAAFLGIRMDRRNVLTLLWFSAASGVLCIISNLLWGATGTQRIYPLIIHLPLVIFLHLYYKYRMAHCALSVMTAYLCCQVSKWVGLVAVSLTDEKWVYYAVRTAVTALVFYLFIRYVSDAAAQLLAKPTKDIAILGLMPLVYYLYDYATNVYTELLYSGRAVIAEFLGFVVPCGQIS